MHTHARYYILYIPVCIASIHINKNMNTSIRVQASVCECLGMYYNTWVLIYAYNLRTCKSTNMTILPSISLLLLLLLEQISDNTELFDLNVITALFKF